ncbi:hypothetical protein ACFYVE_33045 [Streptomyces tendae]|uniref:hypothetical protein n=1 Tax=Streptomyces tendae TaxID=1932 RepID=UPI0036887B92
MTATTVIAAAGMLGTTTPASAASLGVEPPSNGWDHTWYTTNSAGRVQVEEYGDLINVCDVVADGKYPQVHVLAFDSLGDIRRDFTLSAKGGSGACAISSASQGGEHDLPEGSTISVSIWLISGKTNQTNHEYINDN